MTKQELYKALQEAGVQLPDYRRITAAALEEAYANTFGNTPQQSDPQPEQQPGAKQQVGTEPEVADNDDAGADAGEEPNGERLAAGEGDMQQPKEPEQPEEQTGPEGVPPALYFEYAGWCEDLQTSYFMGHYQPKSWAEYEALRPFAKGGNV